MSLSRIIPPVTSSLPIFMFAAASSTASRSCPHALQTLSSPSYRRLSSKRELQTATHYRPHSLDSFPPPPPRNSGVPDTSIAGGPPDAIDKRPPGLAGQHESTSSTPSDETSSVSLPEQEAQKSKPIAPVEPSPSSSTTQSSSKPKRSKLRPRKAAMTITPSATEHLHQLLSQPEPKMIRVGVKNRGCSGLAYHLEFVDKPGKFDEVVEHDGVKVLIDSKALFSIIGSEMDWQEDKLSARFIFRNPNISKYSNSVLSIAVYLIIYRGTMRLWGVLHGLMIFYSRRGVCIARRSGISTI
jgi:iron-sulfur cluster assembly accessory protein